MAARQPPTIQKRMSDGTERGLARGSTRREGSRPIRMWSTWLISVCDIIAMTTGVANETMRLPSVRSTASCMPETRF